LVNDRASRRVSARLARRGGGGEWGRGGGSYRSPLRGKRAIVEVKIGVLCEKAWASERGAALVDVLRRGRDIEPGSKQKAKAKVFWR
jgi:hypothetical protein